MKFVYKDVSVKIPGWPFYGEVIATFECETITEADKLFSKEFPEHTHKGNLKSTISVSLS
jgi:hypothetical protein